MAALLLFWFDFYVYYNYYKKNYNYYWPLLINGLFSYNYLLSPNLFLGNIQYPKTNYIKRTRGRRSGKKKSKDATSSIPMWTTRRAFNSGVKPTSYHSLRCCRNSYLRKVPFVTRTNLMKLGIWNARSVNNKTVHYQT